MLPRHEDLIAWRLRFAAWLVVPLLLSGCAPKQVGVMGFRAKGHGVYMIGDTASYPLYAGGEYIPKALANVQDFGGYAGYVITYYGPLATDGTGCDPNGAMRIDVGHQSMMLSGQKAEKEQPNGKLDELVIASEQKASAGFLAFFSAQVTDSTSVQLLIQDVAAETARNVLNEDKISAVKNSPLPTGACARRLIRNAVLTEGQAKLFHSVGRDASVSGFNIKINGSWHNSTESFQRELYVRVETSEL